MLSLQFVPIRTTEGFHEMAKSKIAEIIATHEADLLAEWVKAQASGSGRHLSEDSIRSTSSAFLSALREAAVSGDAADINRPEWGRVREILGEVSRTRVEKGFSPSETATMIFSLKQPLFERLRKEFGNNAQGLADEIWASTQLLDKLGLHITELFQKSRESLIN